MKATSGTQWILPDLSILVAHLVGHYDEVIGPVVHDGVIRLRPIRSADELPTGYVDVQETGSYLLEHTGSRRRFAHGPGPDSLKAIVHPPEVPVWTMRRRDGSLVVDPALQPTVSRAVIGARACDVRALAILERTQTGGPHVDPTFAANRAGLFVVAVDCEQPAPTCFCDTAGGGPVAEDGFDLALTELEGPRAVTYLVRAGSDDGRSLVERLHLAPAPDDHVRIAREYRAQARQQFIRVMPESAETAVRDPDHPRWDEVADRCLTCGNCTAVCPTCFCTDMDDRVELDGTTATRTRIWDTCFSLEYSHLGEGALRASRRARFRQWLTQKVGTWHEQFGETRSVG